MINLALLKNVLSLTTELILAIVAFVGLIAFKKAWQKALSILALVVVLCSFGLSFYLQLNDSTTSAEMHLSAYKPMVVNVNGTFADELVENADYRVLCDAAFPLDTKFSVVMTNMKTLEANRYNISDVYEGMDIGVVESGRYKLELYIDSQLRQTDIVVLNTENLNEAGVWDHSIYVFDDFFDRAVKADVSIGEQVDQIEIPSFTIYADGACRYAIFETEIDPSGRFEGDFYFLPGVHYVDNAVTSRTMEEVIINIE